DRPLDPFTLGNLFPLKINVIDPECIASGVALLHLIVLMTL
ncbi:23056_t:CDS:2, partial [Gigaspora rosea]